MPHRPPCTISFVRPPHGPVSIVDNPKTSTLWSPLGLAHAYAKEGSAGGPVAAEGCCTRPSAIGATCVGLGKA